MRSRIVLLTGRRRGAVLLDRLLQSGFPVVGCIVMEEDSHEERWEERITAVAARSGIECLVAKTLNSGPAAEWLRCWNPRIVVAENWRTLIPPRVFEPVGHFVVLHESLLPHYRGFAPLSWPIINGESHTGVTLFYIAEEVDSGDVIDQRTLPIEPDDTVNDLYERTICAYWDVLQRNLPLLEENLAPRRAQDHTRATYGCTRTPEDGRIPWEAPSAMIYNLARGLAPPLMPGAWTTYRGQRLTVCAARPLKSPPAYTGRIPGRVVKVCDAAVWVLTGDGVMVLETIRPGDAATAPLAASAVIRSIRATLGG